MFLRTKDVQCQNVTQVLRGGLNVEERSDVSISEATGAVVSVTGWHGGRGAREIGVVLSFSSL